jgi:uncharacterized protein YutE (UPF0331/DUF86 family)
MPRAKKTTTTHATGGGAELNVELTALQKKVREGIVQKDALLQKIGGLRAHIVQNNIDTTEVLRLLENIINDS